MSKIRRLIFISSTIATFVLFGLAFYVGFTTKDISAMNWLLLSVVFTAVIMGVSDNVGHL